MFTVLDAPVFHSSSPDFQTIMVSLEPMPQAVRYIFIIIRSDAAGNKIKKTTTSFNETFTDLEPGTWYTIKVHALDANGVPGDDKIKQQVTSKRQNSIFLNAHRYFFNRNFIIRYCNFLIFI